jgi:DNA-3-methyladenine glycosylase II
LVYFKYGHEETDYLCEQDPVLGAAIERIGHLSNPVEPDLFCSLISHIISQQISYKAANTVWQRFRSAYDPIDPAQIAAEKPEKIQSLGMSMRKADYIRSIAQQIAVGRLNIDKLSEASDTEVRRQLVELPGIGNWTVDMLMIFSLQRQDIMSWHDLAVRRGLARLHNLNQLDKNLFEHYKRLYSPFGTIASFYLWEIAHETT